MIKGMLERQAALFLTLMGCSELVSWLRHCCAPQGQLLDELDQEVEGTSTRIAAAQVRHTL